jgi:hypothetical protein
MRHENIFYTACIAPGVEAAEIAAQAIPRFEARGTVDYSARCPSMSRWKTIIDSVFTDLEARAPRAERFRIEVDEKNLRRRNAGSALRVSHIR